ncbi:hypothetical protein COU77_01200 [Candidatus Peregrinibacteria bacterium CG10_big_fil_rev_8_21_14_0_10_49_16]|nr:MAG: hypothetical protein COU77_01200 [Candidatus Peregrinibacteria bacterium CG10_big_fil_rev_8_21_14_0_10_49_16]
MDECLVKLTLRFDPQLQNIRGAIELSHPNTVVVVGDHTIHHGAEAQRVLKLEVSSLKGRSHHPTSVRMVP